MDYKHQLIRSSWNPEVGQEVEDVWNRSRFSITHVSSNLFEITCLVDKKDKKVFRKYELFWIPNNNELWNLITTIFRRVYVHESNSENLDVVQFEREDGSHLNLTSHTTEPYKVLEKLIELSVLDLEIAALYQKYIQSLASAMEEDTEES